MFNGIEPRGEIRIPSQVWTFDGFLEWTDSPDAPAGWRASRLGGEIVLEPRLQEIFTHLTLKDEMTRVLRELARRQGLGRYWGDGVQLTKEDVELATQPDGLFVAYAALEAGAARFVYRPDPPTRTLRLEGAPDMVLEVVSRWSVRKDTRELRELYHRAGIAEYWLIDARDEEIDFQILKREAQGYVENPRDGDWRPSTVFGRSFHLARSIDQAGVWDYELWIR